MLFLQQWHDEVFPRASTLTLFDLIASRNKRLHAHPGKHAAVPPVEMFASKAFLAGRLKRRRSARCAGPKSPVQVTIARK